MQQQSSGSPRASFRAGADDLLCDRLEAPAEKSDDIPNVSHPKQQTVVLRMETASAAETKVHHTLCSTREGSLNPVSRRLSYSLVRPEKAHPAILQKDCCDNDSE